MASETYTGVQILQADGMRGLYRGCLTNLVRTTPAAAITFTSYEVISRNLSFVAHVVDNDGPRRGGGGDGSGGAAGADAAPAAAGNTDSRETAAEAGGGLPPSADTGGRAHS